MRRPKMARKLSTIIMSNRCCIMDCATIEHIVELKAHFGLVNVSLRKKRGKLVILKYKAYSTH